MRNISGFTRTATLALALAFPVAATAFADEYDSAREHEAVILQAASSKPAPALTAEQAAKLSSDFKVGESSTLGAERSSQLAPVPLLAPSRVASLAHNVAGQVDLVGSGGAQDQLANEIYHPGSGTNAD